MIFVPKAEESVGTDDDCAQTVWKRERKVFAVNTTCYGSYTAWIGLRNPAGGTKYVTFDEGWKWFCNDSEDLNG